jgi:sialic acid synthase SpsE
MEQRRNVPKGSYDILAWPAAWIGLIREYTESVGIEFLCTVFLPCDVAVLNEHVKRWKVASLESSCDELVNAMIVTKKDVIASYGATDDLQLTGWLHSALHCTLAYPASPESLNLRAIYRNGFDGYSDHSCDVLTGALAVACGAEIIEVHFKLPSTPNGNPDFPHSHFPDGLKQYIQNIRKAEQMLGDGQKKIEPCEEWALKHKVKA